MTKNTQEIKAKITIQYDLAARSETRASKSGDQISKSYWKGFCAALAETRDFIDGLPDES